MAYNFKGGATIATSFDYVEIATGRGIKKFYGGDTASGASIVLSSTTFYSDQGMSSSAINTAATYNFDLELARPMDISDTAIVNVPVLLCVNASGGSPKTHVYTTAAKVSEGTEELLASGASYCDGGGLAANLAEPYMVATSFEIPRTHYKAGDTLRLKIETEAPGINSAVCIGHDPMNRDIPDWDKKNNCGSSSGGWGTSPTILTFHVPIVIDI